jgi:hypothetical protein
LGEPAFSQGRRCDGAQQQRARQRRASRQLRRVRREIWRGRRDLNPRAFWAPAPETVNTDIAEYRSVILQPLSRYPGIPEYPQMSRNGYEMATFFRRARISFVRCLAVVRSSSSQMF